MTFSSLLDALRDETRRRIANGYYTERGLARRSGISQPQVHNVLAGKRALTPHVADVLLDALGLTVFDLI